MCPYDVGTLANSSAGEGGTAFVEGGSVSFGNEVLAAPADKDGVA